jgi:MFS superfamily sulfate permease-like transporter
MAMVAGSYGWTWIQKKATRAQGIPSVLVAILIGLSGTWAFAGNSGETHSGVSVGILESGYQWTSVMLWNSLESRQIGALLMLVFQVPSRWRW